MLKPAILYRQEIIKAFQEYYYTDDMFYETGCNRNWIPEISEESDEYQYAIVNSKNSLIGYIGYYVDWYADSVSRFGLFSFDRGNPIVGKDIFELMEKLVTKHHRVEWKMIGGNPVERHYDKFCEKHNGKKFVLTDAIKDRNGNYQNYMIYEIVKGNEE